MHSSISCSVKAYCLCFVDFYVLLLFALFTFVTCFAFGLFLHQCQSSSPFLTDQSHSCENDEVWRAPLSPELRTRLGSAGRRGSAPVIDTQRANQINQLHAFIQSQRSISPIVMVPENHVELSPKKTSPQPSSEAEDTLLSPSALPMLLISPISSPSVFRRLSDASFTSPLEATSENLTIPNPSARRHSDLSSLLSLTSNQKHLSGLPVHGNPTCQACLSLLLSRSQDCIHRSSVISPTYLCPCDLRHHPLSGGKMTSSGYGQSKGSSDYLDLSVLQQSLFNIISRRPVPCHTTPTQTSSAAPRSSGRDGDCGPKSKPQSPEPLQECEDKYCSREQKATTAAGVVGYSSKHVALVSCNEANTCFADFSQPLGSTSFSCMKLDQTPVNSYICCLHRL